uniref:Uncharacterized protein n=1 Tax=Acrobeloides nanus TaxID=290746 RepID=A0A914D3M0_9BILA
MYSISRQNNDLGYNKEHEQDSYSKFIRTYRRPGRPRKDKQLAETIWENLPERNIFPMKKRRKENEELVQMIRDRKETLFSFITPSLSGEEKAFHWLRIFQECVKLGHFWTKEKERGGRKRDVNFLRHSKWNQIRNGTMLKIDRSRKNNVPLDLTKVDKMVLEIIGTTPTEDMEESNSNFDSPENEEDEEFEEEEEANYSGYVETPASMRSTTLADVKSEAAYSIKKEHTGYEEEHQEDEPESGAQSLVHYPKLSTVNQNETDNQQEAQCVDQLTAHHKQAKEEYRRTKHAYRKMMLKNAELMEELQRLKVMRLCREMGIPEARAKEMIAEVEEEPIYF